MQDFEKLGVFYLGKRYEPATAAVADDLILYDAKDLTTHGVVVGMTGSGKTGLSLGLLEEAAMDGIPAIAIDPKGDLGNLMLTFPELRPGDFRPWVDEQEAARKGMSADEYARSISSVWKKGLGEWGQDGERIRRMKEQADFSIYTPGSAAGRPLSVLRSLQAPSAAVAQDPEALGERVQAAVAGLLALLGISGDPLRSRENILLANILQTCWLNGQSLDLGGMIMAVQQPPFEKIGVFDLESFYPSRERFELAMQLNNLLASPGFGAWMEGEPLDIQSLLYTPEGKPRISILYIAQLSDAERMFFVTLLLNEVLAWMRAQPGTSSLRALLYMDEIFGYFPPSAEPPSKRPMLTLLKQARAYGLGVLLATQNPVDLDYKGLANTGTWFIGRLQTERDKMRVLDGLEGASASAGQSFDRSQMEAILSGLGNRVFLMNNVHESGPVLFQTRWVMSYLRGPLTRTQIQALHADAAPGPAPGNGPSPAPTIPVAGLPPASPETGGVPGLATKPPVPAEIRESFGRALGMPSASEVLVYRPQVIAHLSLHYTDAKSRVDEWMETQLIADGPAGRQAFDWEGADVFNGNAPESAPGPASGARFLDVPGPLANPKNYPIWSKQLISHAYKAMPLELFYCEALREYSRPGETEGAFRGRLAHLSREQRDLEVEKIRARFQSKLATLEDRVRKAEQKVEKEEEQYKQSKVSAALSMGATLVGALFGRKKVSYTNLSRAGTAIRGAGRATKEKSDIARAEDDLSALREKFAELEAECEEAVREMETRHDASALSVEAYPVAPRKSDLQVREIAIWWQPSLEAR